MEWCSLRDGLHRFREHTVNTELDGDRIVARLDVNITGSPLQRREDRRVDQADDRADVTLGRELVDRDRFLAGGLVFTDNIEREALAGFFQNALRLLGLLQNVADLLQGADFGEDPFAQQEADLVDHHQLAGIGDRDGQLPVPRFLQRHEVVAEHQVDGHLLEEFMLQLETVQIHELAAIAARDVLCPIGLCGRFLGNDLPISSVATTHDDWFLFRHSQNSHLPSGGASGCPEPAVPRT